MSQLIFAKTLDAAVRGHDHVIFLAPAAAQEHGQAWKRVFRGAWTKALARMTQDAEPGDLGKVLTTWIPSGSPRVASLGLLPNAVSRHVSPSRNHAIHHCLAKLEPRRGRVGVVLQLDDPAHAIAAVGAVGRAFPLYTRKTARKAPRVTVACLDARGKLVPLTRELQWVVEGARWTASLVDRPTAELTTADFVEEAQKFLGETKSKVTVRVLVGDELAAAGLGGIHAVGRGAEVAPRLLHMEAKPAPKRGERARRVALVGKGIVFDTGGLDLKSRDGMTGMKGDMGGGAAVVGAFRALVREGTPHHLHCLVPLAENAIGPHSYRPDEILTLHSGKTVEINNTDAEGRLLLADAVSHAARDLRADVIVNAATLTGAQSISTGRRHAAVVSNREGLEQLAVRAGRISGDLCHPLPFAPEFYQREFKSELADMTNSVKDRANAQSSCAAQFVWSHVDDTDVAWLHVDLAAPAMPEQLGTGFGVALLAEIVRGLDDATLAD